MRTPVQRMTCHLAKVVEVTTGQVVRSSLGYIEKPSSTGTRMRYIIGLGNASDDDFPWTYKVIAKKAFFWKT